jgi:hypothetical protein
MTREQLDDVIAGRKTITRRLAIVMAETLRDVLTTANDSSPARDWEGAQSAVLAYCTAKRVVAAVVQTRELP